MAAWPRAVLQQVRGSFAVARRGRGQVFDSAGVRIRYFDSGAGEAVVLIHGYTRTAAAWAASGFAGGLTRDHRVLALDCRGHGRSGRPSGPAAYGACMADDVIRMLDHAGIDAAHVIGHSMGGRIALRLAATRPDRVRSAVLIASGGTLASRSVEDPMPIERVAESLESGKGLAPLLEAVLPPATPLPRWKFRLLDWAASATNDPRALAAAARGYVGLAVTDAQLATLRMPVSAVVGSEDPYRTAVAALARRVPGMAPVVLEGATHLDVLRRPETLLAVQRFLANCRIEARRAAAA